MPKRDGSGEPRPINFRVTTDEGDVLDAWAYLQDSTPTEVARAELRILIERVRTDPRVQRVLKERAEVRAERSGTLTPLRPRRADETPRHVD